MPNGARNFIGGLVPISAPNSAKVRATLQCRSDESDYMSRHGTNENPSAGEVGAEKQKATRQDLVALRSIWCRLQDSNPPPDDYKFSIKSTSY